MRPAPVLVSALVLLTGRSASTAATHHPASAPAGASPSPSAVPHDALYRIGYQQTIHVFDTSR